MFVPRMVETLALGALTTKNVVKADFGQVLDQEVWAISADCIPIMREHAVNEGPITIGLAHGDYTDAEIEEWYEDQASWLQGDKIAQERARRKIRVITTFQGLSELETVNDGNPVRVNLKFKLQDGETLSLWAYNEDGNTLTTGTIIDLKGRVYLRPM